MNMEKMPGVDNINEKFRKKLSPEAHLASISTKLDKNIKIGETLAEYPIVKEVVKELGIDVDTNHELVKELVDFVKKRKGVDLNDEKEAKMLKEALTKKAGELSEAA